MVKDCWKQLLPIILLDGLTVSQKDPKLRGVTFGRWNKAKGIAGLEQGVIR